MGGSGSGNFYHYHRGRKKTAVEDCLSIDANRWMREGILRAGVGFLGTRRWTYRSGGTFSVAYLVNTLDLQQPLLHLSYSWTWAHSKEPQSASYTVCLTTTPQHLGGVRWWFGCPLVVNGHHCGRRVGKLYLPSAARYFGCRRCHNLTYTSCQESGKLDRIHALLAVDMGISLQEFKRQRRLLEKLARRRTS